MIEVGNQVTWDSQSGGHWKTKTGTVIGFCKSQAKAYSLLPAKTKASHIKFQSRSDFDRIIVLVPRGGKSTLSDYYAPRVTQVKLVQEQPAQ